MLASFCEERLRGFATDRNDPNKKALSNLSPWIHFGFSCTLLGLTAGQLSAHRAVLTVKQHAARFPESVKAYVEVRGPPRSLLSP
jgi:deoxyribodipyrimidine photo-lyase